MAQGWKLGRRQGACAACESPFVEGEEVFSLLRFEQDDLQRGDLCAECFEQHDPAQDVVFWRTHQSERRGALKVDFDLVQAALPDLAADARDERRDLAFLLALLLVRHRRLRMQGVLRRQGREYLVVRPVRSQKTFEVEARDLDSERRARLTARLTEMLDPTVEGGFEDLLASRAGGADAAAS